MTLPATPQFDELRAEVFRTTGVSLPADDPSIALVMLNQCVIQHYVASLEEELRAILGDRLEAIRTQAVKWAAEQMVEQQLNARDQIEFDLSRASSRVDRLIRRIEWGQGIHAGFWLILGTLIAVLLLAIGVVIGQSF